MLQPDLGSSLVYMVIVLAVLFMAGTAWQHFAALAALGAVAITLVLVARPAAGVTVLKPYQKDRLTAFLNPTDNPDKEGYQQNQSRIAIGSGEKTGRGDDATQTKLNFLPEHHTDFVFAVVGERWGFAGAALVLSLYALLIWRGLRILTMAKNLFGALIAGGIVAMLLFQVFVNVGMTVGIMPITGHPPAAHELRRLLGHHHLPGRRPAAVDLRARARVGCRQGPRAGLLAERRPHMKKQVLVSVDRGETRVALLEATGKPAATAAPRPGRRRKPAAEPIGLPRRGAVLRAPRQPLDRRQHLQGQGRQRPARPGGGVRRHRPRQERLPARRRDRAAGRRDAAAAAAPEGGKKITDLLKPGQEIVVQVVKDPLKTKGARLSMELTVAGPLHGLHPDRRGRRRLQAPGGQGARAPAQGGQGARPAGRRRDRPHRGARRQARGLRARAAVPVQAPRGPRAARRGDAGARPRLPGGRPLGPRRARHLRRRLRARDGRRPQAVPAPGLVLHPHRPRARRARRAVEESTPLFETPRRGAR